tara:strand:+ start:10352 stop:10501 length:150 start_codon:yes stop_codon:yes gene_type:complete
MNNIVLGVLIILIFLALYTVALLYVEKRIAKQENENLKNNIDKLNEKAQ